MHSINNLNSENYSFQSFIGSQVHANNVSVSNQIKAENSSTIKADASLNSRGISILSFSNSLQAMLTGSGNKKIPVLENNNQDKSQVTNLREQQILKYWDAYMTGDMNNEYDENFEKTQDLISCVIKDYIGGSKAEAKATFQKFEVEINDFISFLGPKTHRVLIRLINILLVLDKEGFKEKILNWMNIVVQTFSEFVECSQGEENARYYRLFCIMRAYHQELSASERESLLERFWAINQRNIEGKNDYLDFYYSTRGKILEKVGRNKEALEAYSKAYALRYIGDLSYLLGLSCANIARVCVNKKNTNLKKEWEMMGDSYNMNYKEVDISKHHELLMGDPFYKILLDQYIPKPKGPS